MRKGKTGWASARYLALDFETTGLDADVDEVISYGTVWIEGGRVEMAGLSYAEASPSEFASDASVHIHGLMPADLARSAGRLDLTAQLRSTIGDNAMIVSWAAWVEAAFLATALGGSSPAWRRRIIDVRDLVAHHDLLSSAESPVDETLVACAVRHGVPTARAHHALGDAVMTAQLFVVVATRLQRAGKGTVRDMLSLGRRAR
jgi:DNA polymerase-3 subunit epsilon